MRIIEKFNVIHYLNEKYAVTSIEKSKTLGGVQIMLTPVIELKLGYGIIHSKHKALILFKPFVTNFLPEMLKLIGNDGEYANLWWKLKRPIKSIALDMRTITEAYELKYVSKLVSQLNKIINNSKN
jgi:hypothetical protein